MDVLESLVHRAKDLYTLPSVAVEVLELTSQSNIDSRALKECIECDPAISAKILRVVNSSLFGLSTEIIDLNQALTLLGTKPLKLLVLGFNLPDTLFTGVTSEQLVRYWTVALIRAVAAREVAQNLWKCEGDEAFIAGLLEDLGILVLLKELGEPYARMMDSVWHEHADLSVVERMSLGFDHRLLTTALLAHWGIPTLLVDAIAAPRSLAKLKALDKPHAQVARILHLASLITDLVGRHQLNVLPELLECGGVYVQLTRAQLDGIIDRLEPMVRDLADVFSFQLLNELHFNDIVLQAHQQMSSLAEEVSGCLAQMERTEQQLSEIILANARQLTQESADFLAGCQKKNPAAHARQPIRRYHAASLRPPVHEDMDRAALLSKVELAVATARARREELSLLLLKKVDVAKEKEDAIASGIDTLEILTRLRKVLKEEKGISIISSNRCYAAILPGRDRAAAIAYARDLLHRMSRIFANDAIPYYEVPLCIGIASVAVVSKNFAAEKMVDAAQRCLYAAGQSSAGSIKSIELY
ncbi:MAG: HDOD domain-containing protein [Pirellulales bacterium]|nr:HDOD domain-containing protein [Pirellulales bacterium]